MLELSAFELALIGAEWEKQIELMTFDFKRKYRATEVGEKGRDSWDLLLEHYSEFCETDQLREVNSNFDRQMWVPKEEDSTPSDDSDPLLLIKDSTELIHRLKSLAEILNNENSRVDGEEAVNLALQDSELYLIAKAIIYIYEYRSITEKDLDEGCDYPLSNIVKLRYGSSEQHKKLTSVLEQVFDSKHAEYI